MNRFILLFLPVILFLCSCKEKRIVDIASEIIAVNPNEAVDYINLSEIVDSITYIKLEVPSTDIMGRVREIIIKEKYIYAVDISLKQIFVFDKSGNFISKLDKRGRGPDEYLSMGPIFVDDNEEYIDVINYKGEHSTLLRYANINFDLLETLPILGINANSCRRNNDYYYYSTQQLDNYIGDTKTNGSLVLVDKENNTKVLFDKSIETEGSNFSPNIESFTVANNDIFVSLMYDNNFYKLDGDNAYPILFIDFGKYNINNAIGKKTLQEQLDYIFGMKKESVYPVLNIYNSKMIAFSYYFKEQNDRMFAEADFRQYIKMKDSGKVFHFKMIKNDLTEFPDHVYISSYFFNCAHDVLYKDYLVDVILPQHYIPNKINSIYVDGIGEITPHDNPIVVLMKLKNNN